MKKIQLLKSVSFGNCRSKALNATPRTWKANHQKFQFTSKDGKKQTIYTNVRTWRTLKKHFHLSAASQDKSPSQK